MAIPGTEKSVTSAKHDVLEMIHWQSSDTIRPDLDDVGQSCASVGHSSASVGQSLAEIGQYWPILGQRRPTLAEVAQNLDELAKLGQIMAPIPPASADAGPTFGSRRHCSAPVGRALSNFCRTELALRQSWSLSAASREADMPRDACLFTNPFMVAAPQMSTNADPDQIQAGVNDREA